MTGDRRASERASRASRDLASRDLFALTTPRNLSTSFGAGAGEPILRRQLDGGRGWFTNSPLRAETPHAHGFSRTPWSVVRGSMRAQPRAATNLDNQIRPRQSLNSISSCGSLTQARRVSTKCTRRPTRHLAAGPHAACANRRVGPAQHLPLLCRCYVQLAGVPVPHPPTWLPYHM